MKRSIIVTAAALTLFSVNGFAALGTGAGLNFECTNLKNDKVFLKISGFELAPVKVSSLSYDEALDPKSEDSQACTANGSITWKQQEKGGTGVARYDLKIDATSFKNEFKMTLTKYAPDGTASTVHYNNTLTDFYAKLKGNNCAGKKDEEGLACLFMKS